MNPSERAGYRQALEDVDAAFWRLIDHCETEGDAVAKAIAELRAALDAAPAAPEEQKMDRCSGNQHWPDPSKPNGRCFCGVLQVMSEAEAQSWADLQADGGLPESYGPRYFCGGCDSWRYTENPCGREKCPYEESASPASPGERGETLPVHDIVNMPESVNEGLLLQRFSDLLTGGNASTWDHIEDAIQRLTAERDGLYAFTLALHAKQRQAEADLAARDTTIAEMQPLLSKLKSEVLRGRAQVEARDTTIAALRQEAFTAGLPDVS